MVFFSLKIFCCWAIAVAELRMDDCWLGTSADEAMDAPLYAAIAPEHDAASEGFFDIKSASVMAERFFRGDGGERAPDAPELDASSESPSDSSLE